MSKTSLVTTHVLFFILLVISYALCHVGLRQERSVLLDLLVHHPLTVLVAALGPPVVDDKEVYDIQ